MNDIKSQKLVAFARTIEGHLLKTLHRQRPFKVNVNGDHLIFVPETGKKRNEGGKSLDSVCETFSETYSYHPSDYQEVSRNSSYDLALIKEYNKH